MKPKLDIGSTGFGIFPLSLYLSPDLKKSWWPLVEARTYSQTSKLDLVFLDETMTSPSLLQA